MSVIDLMHVERDDRAFVNKRLSPFSEEIQRILLNEYLRQPTKFERNTYLRVTTNTIAKNLSMPLGKIELNLSEEDLRVKAKELAETMLARRRGCLNDERALPFLRGKSDFSNPWGECRRYSYFVGSSTTYRFNCTANYWLLE